MSIQIPQMKFNMAFLKLNLATLKFNLALLKFNLAFTKKHVREKGHEKNAPGMMEYRKNFVSLHPNATLFN